MQNPSEDRPDPAELLEQIQKNAEADQNEGQGRLKIYFGYAAGVGKTYAMLEDAQDLFRQGEDVVLGYLEPHARPETLALKEGLPEIAVQEMQYRGTCFKEFDLDAALRRHPKLILVDELPHSNIPGMRNTKRYMDIEELLRAGIDVATTVNVQHIESLKDLVYAVTRISVRETVPDFIFAKANQVVLVDIEPSDLLKRFEQGKVYSQERTQAALGNFFTRENLALLREIALRKIADRISSESSEHAQMRKVKTRTRIAACISPSPSSARTMRFAARMAQAFHARWEAVYVQTASSPYFSEEQNKRLRQNMELAESLGGTLVVLSGEDIFEAISSYAKRNGVTSVVFGQRWRDSWIDLAFSRYSMRRLMQQFQDVNVHFVPAREDPPSVHKGRRRAALLRSFPISGKDTLRSLGIFGATTLLGLGLFHQGVLAERNIIMIYLLSIILIARFTQGFLYSTVTSLAGVLAFNFFFTAPFYTFNAYGEGYPMTFLIMFAVALITSTMTSKVVQQAELAADRESRTQLLYDINKKLLATREAPQIGLITAQAIAQFAHLSVLWYGQDPAHPVETAPVMVLLPGDEARAKELFSEEERAVAHFVYVNNRRAGAGTDTLRGAHLTYLPVSISSKVLGVVGIDARSRVISQPEKNFLGLLLGQVAMAIERVILSKEQRDTLLEAEREKMRGNLLRAISHDIRTPLTSILGASSALLEQGGRIEPKTAQGLLEDIRSHTQWLINMVENLLSITRINEGTANIHKQVQAAEEVVAEAIDKVRLRFKDFQSEVQVPEQLLLVPMDATLIEQVLINLIENAIRHGGNRPYAGIRVYVQAGQAVFEVYDQGKGIDVARIQSFFQGTAPEGESPRTCADASHGMGLGLSICMTIIKAHKGTLEASNRPQGGAVFRFCLPLEDENPSKPKKGERKNV